MKMAKNIGILLINSEFQGVASQKSYRIFKCFGWTKVWLLSKTTAHDSTETD